MNNRSVFFTASTPAALAAARQLALAGDKVYMNNPGEAPEGVSAVCIDTSDRSALLAFLRSLDNFGAIVIPTLPPTQVKIADFTDEQWNTNRNAGVYSALAATQAAGEVFFENKTCGTILFLSTVHAEKPTGGSFMHSIEAGAEQMLCREAAHFYGRFGIKVHFLMLGPVEGNYDGFVNEVSGIYHGVEEQMADGRPISPCDAAPLIKFLLSPDARPLNGSDIRADNAFTLYFNSFKEGGLEHHE